MANLARLGNAAEIEAFTLVMNVMILRFARNSNRLRDFMVILA